MKGSRMDSPSMQGDRGYWRFFAYIGLFVFSMTMLVSASNFVMLFVFWEAVGVCSYLLVGFWYEKPEAAAAGKKAFLVNRVGDVGFMLLFVGRRDRDSAEAAAKYFFLSIASSAVLLYGLSFV